MATYVPAKRATAYRFTLSLFARSDNQIKTAPTLASGDVKVSKDNGATANITTLPAETPASSGILQVDLSATEMTADLVTVIFRDAAGAEWNDVAVHIATAARQIDDLAFPNTSGRGMDVDASGGVEVGSFQAGAITAAAIATGAIDADAIATDAVTEIQSGLATAAALAVVDDFLDTEIAAIITAVDALPTNAELATALGTADDAVLAAIAALNNLSAAQVNAEVVDALATDTYAEPGQGTPAATASLASKIGYLYKAWRNKKTVTATTHSLFADDATTVDQKSTVSDAAGTFTETEKATGP